jgi:hypothetical protein
MSTSTSSDKDAEKYRLERSLDRMRFKIARSRTLVGLAIGRAPRRPSIEAVHRDLAFANAYRQEFIKSLILIAGALFAFSVSFRPELRVTANEGLFWISWIALGISMLGGFAQLACWERYYSSYQKFEHKGKSGKRRRSWITLMRRLALLCQVVGFIAGVAALGSFTALNLSNFEKKTSSSQTGTIAPAERR